MDLIGNDKLVTVTEVAEMLSVPVSWIYDHTRARGLQRIPHVKLGKYLRFDVHAVRTWVTNFQEN